MKFLVISIGDSATNTTPLLATSDRAVIGAAMDALLERSGVIDATDQDKTTGT